jgi:hypothetical protein
MARGLSTNCRHFERGLHHENLQREYCHPGIYFRANYIGDGAELTLTRKKPVEHGWHPYE